MPLLTSLGLKPTKAMATQAVAPAGSSNTVPAPPTKAAAAVPKKGGANQPQDPAREAALALSGELEARLKTAQAQLARLSEGQEKLKKVIASAKGEQKKALESKQKLLDKAVADAEKAADQVSADLDALANPATRRDEFAAILARAKSKATLSSATEIDTGAESLAKKLPGEFSETKTTSSFADGRAMTSKEEKKRSIGLDGVTQTTNKETTETTADGSWKTSQEKTAKVGPKGVSLEEKKTFEAERGDKKVTLEKGKSTEVGKDGVTQTTSTTLTRSDGSATSNTTTGGVERGEGKLGGSLGKTNSETDTAGDVTTKGAKGKAGAMAGEKGYGGFAEAEGKVSRETKSGFKTGAVAGLNSNIVCNIGDPEGEPPLYPLTLEVNLGGSINLSAGQGKKDAAVQSGVEAKVGAAVFMKHKHMLGEAEAASYVQALKDISAGGKGAATHKEFAIIQAGIQQGWKVAQAMFRSGGKPLSPAMLAALTQTGDSIEVGGGKNIGAKAAVSVKAVSVEAGVEESDEHSTKVTRNKEGTLDVDMSAGSTSKTSGKVGINSGIVGGSAGRSHTVKTTAGYEITIDPKNDPDGKLFEALSACGNAADYDAFLAKYGKKVTVKGKTVGRAESDTEEVGLSVGPAKVGIGLNSGIAEEKTTDGEGKLKGSKVVGTAGGGGAVELGGMSIGDSVADAATAERDADGNASLDLSRTRKATDLDKVVKVVKGKIPFVGDDEKDKETGALAKATGGGKESETQSQDVAGIKLSNKDLDRIGLIACNEWSRWRSAVRRYQEIGDWDNAGKAIRAAKGERGVVADELARFIGGDKIHRLDMVNHFIRPGGDVSAGRGYEFPESLKSLRAEYDKLVVGASEQQIAQVAEKEGAQKAGEAGKKIFDSLEKLLQAFTSAKDFAQPAVKAEMLSAITNRKGLVLAAMRKAAGKTSEQDDKVAATEEYRRLLKECVQYEVLQNGLFDQIKDLLGDRSTIMVANGDFAKASKHIKQIADLVAVWNGDYKKAVTLAKQIEMPESHYAKFQPNLVEFKRLKKACLISS